jgi:ATP phosphoribosyltransferase
VRVSTEYPELTRRFFAEHGIDADIRLSYGASEAKIPDIADCIVDITETGRALRAAGLRIIEEMLQSYTEVVANRASFDDPAKRHAMGQLMTLLNGTLDARGKVLVKMNVAAAQLDAVLALVPSLKAPTVNPLAGDGGFAVETVVAKRQINILIPELKEAGATGILELPISKIIA